MPPNPAPTLISLLERYERPLIRYAQGFVGDLENARDIVQETFIRYVRVTEGAQLAKEEGFERSEKASAIAEPEGAVRGHRATRVKEEVEGAPTGLDNTNPKHVEGWLFMVTRNRALDHIRKHSRIIPMPLPEDRHSEEPGPDETLASADAADWLLRLLDALTPNQREVIRLKFQNDLSYKEIADLTGLTQTNVGFLLHVGLKKLRTLLHEAPVDTIPFRLRSVI